MFGAPFRWIASARRSFGSALTAFKGDLHASHSGATIKSRIFSGFPREFCEYRGGSRVLRILVVEDDKQLAERSNI